MTKMTKKKPLALFDLDGTMADWDGAMRRDLEVFQKPNDPPLPYVLDTNSAPWRDRASIIKGQIGWWRNLAPLQDGIDLLKMTQDLGFKVQVLTKGPKRFPLAWSEKVQWCQQHMPGIGVNIVMNKENYYGRVLVDDYVAYVDKWLDRRPRGLVIMPDRPWNQGYEHERCVRYRDRDTLQGEIREALQAQLDRE